MRFDISIETWFIYSAVFLLACFKSTKKSTSYIGFGVSSVIFASNALIPGLSNLQAI